MTWTKLGDEFADECWTLPDEAFRLHAEGLIWSNRKHLDGRLAKDEMPRWAKRPEAATELADVGFWEDCGDHFQIIHHLGYQRTAAEWRHQSTVNRANRSKRKPKSNDSSNGSLNHSLNDSHNDSLISNDSSNDSYYERDWSGLDRTGLGKEPNYVSANVAKIDRSDELAEMARADSEADNATSSEFEDCFAAGAAWEPPTTDADGFPLDDQ